MQKKKQEREKETERKNYNRGKKKKHMAKEIIMWGEEGGGRRERCPAVFHSSIWDSSWDLLFRYIRLKQKSCRAWSGLALLIVKGSSCPVASALTPRESCQTYSDLKTQNNGDERKNAIQYKEDPKLLGFLFLLPPPGRTCKSEDFPLHASEHSPPSSQPLFRALRPWLRSARLI